jgi:malonyl-CoA/methylmalonyl-CoA synthetase
MLIWKGVTNPPEELLYFVEKSQQIALLSSSSAADLARSVISLAKEKRSGLTPVRIDVSRVIFSSASKRSLSEIVISSDRYLDDNAAGVVIFTSGTTGKPKGAVLRRAYIHETALNVIDGYDIDYTDVVLHTLPVHHATGLGTTFFTFLIAGACIEFRTHGSFDPAWVWDRLKHGGITVFSGVPTMFLRLMWQYEKAVAPLPAKEQQEYTGAIKTLKCMLSGSSALQQPVQDFFTQLRANGKPGIFVRYGSSEIPGCIRVSANADFSRLPPDSVGSPTTGVAVKISPDGELLIKSPLMFSGYLFDKDATRAAHDDDGWFKTGDIARQEGPYIYIVGRASLDIIKSGGYKIGALEVERACMQMPYVREVAVMGVEDEEYGQRVAAAIVLDGNILSTLQLSSLRNDLRQLLPAYKLPTLLRIVERELPKGDTGKVQKRLLGPKLFPVPGWQKTPEVQATGKDKSMLTSKL